MTVYGNYFYFYIYYQVVIAFLIKKWGILEKIMKTIIINVISIMYVVLFLIALIIKILDDDE